MAERLLPAEDRLLALMADAARGPRRNGLFALWLVVRHCDGRLSPDPLSDRADRRRLARTERRLTTLSLPAPLRRALAGAVRALEERRANGVAMALHQLVTPTRETLGGAAADALGLAARAARRAGAAGADP